MMKPVEVAAHTDDLLVQFIDTSPGQGVPTPTPTSPPGTSEVQSGPTSAPLFDDLPRTRRRRHPSAPPVLHDSYERIGTTLGLLFSLALGIGLWITGAWCTLQFLADVGVDVVGLGNWAWLIPVGISGAELFLWPQQRNRAIIGFTLLAVLAFVVGTTYAGFVAVSAGRVIPLFAGIQLPDSGPGLAVLGVAAGLLCAFGPERIGRWVLADLYVLWRGRLWT